MPRDGKDQLEVAAELQDELNRRGIEQARIAAEAEKHPDFDGVSCLDCGDDIPEKRLELGRIRCVLCQERKEKRR